MSDQECSDLKYDPACVDIMIRDFLATVQEGFNQGGTCHSIVSFHD